VLSAAELSRKTTISPRQLQRLFLEFVGVSPKKITDLVRFQNIWQAMYYSRTQDFGDIVYRYQYTDQSHFNNDFKKYAGRTPTEALKYAKA
jgi:AraC-like DNA-binding protein